MTRVPVYILAGGKSSRFGSDKARAMWRGQPLVKHVASLVSGHASSVTVVADVIDKYADLGLRTIADHTPGQGPLGGLATAADDLGESRWLLLCSCDALVIEPTWLDTLIHVTQSDDPTIEAAAFRAEFWQPMPGLYGKSCGIKAAELATGEQRSMQRLLGMLNASALPLPEDWPLRWQANRPSDLEER